MRRNDREITDFDDIIDVLERANTIRLGLHAEPYPYVVPLSFGFETVDGKIVLYFHGAKDGFKHDLIAKNPLVCVETDIFHRYIKVSDSISAEYESFIGFGRVTRVAGAEAIKGMDLLLDHCSYSGFVYDQAAFDATWVYKIELDSFSGKHRFI